MALVIATQSVSENGSDTGQSRLRNEREGERIAEPFMLAIQMQQRDGDTSIRNNRASSVKRPQHDGELRSAELNGR